MGYTGIRCISTVDVLGETFIIIEVNITGKSTQVVYNIVDTEIVTE